MKYSENSDNFELIFISVHRSCTINKNWYAINDVLENTHESIYWIVKMIFHVHINISECYTQSKEYVSDKENLCCYSVQYYKSLCAYYHQVFSNELHYSAAQ